jgi:hypothetical protein
MIEARLTAKDIVAAVLGCLGATQLLAVPAQ